MASSNRLESELIERTTQVISPCRTALQLIEAWRQQGSDGPDRLADLLRPVMQLIADGERELSPLRLAWNEQQLQMGPESRKLIEEHSDLLRRMLLMLDEVAAGFAEPRMALTRQLDVSRRQTAMRQAYRS